MDDDLQTIEAELKRLRPAVPRPALACRIEADLQRPRPAAWTTPWRWGLLLPAAAALAVLLAKPWRIAPAGDRASEAAVPAVTGADAAVLKPVAVENLLYSAQDEGIVTLGDGTPARQERLRYVDTITWRNPRTNASLKWTVPREEVRVVPVSLQ